MLFLSMHWDFIIGIKCVEKPLKYKVKKLWPVHREVFEFNGVILFVPLTSRVRQELQSENATDFNFLARTRTSLC